MVRKKFVEIFGNVFSDSARKFTIVLGNVSESL